MNRTFACRRPTLYIPTGAAKTSSAGQGRPQRIHRSWYWRRVPMILVAALRQLQSTKHPWRATNERTLISKKLSKAAAAQLGRESADLMVRSCPTVDRR